jgi:hypothetical protein
VSESQPIVQERRQGPGGASEEKKTSVTNELSEQPSALVREEDFTKQLRLARYLAGASLGRPRELESALKVKTPKQGRGTRKAPTKGQGRSGETKGWGGGIGEGEAAGWAAGSAEDAASGSHRSEKQRGSPNR